MSLSLPFLLLLSSSLSLCISLSFFIWWNEYNSEKGKPFHTKYNGQLPGQQRTCWGGVWGFLVFLLQLGENGCLGTRYKDTRSHCVKAIDNFLYCGIRVLVKGQIRRLNICLTSLYIIGDKVIMIIYKHNAKITEGPKGYWNAAYSLKGN